jgi:hypothetical protein
MTFESASGFCWDTVRVVDERRSATCMPEQFLGRLDSVT